MRILCDYLVVLGLLTKTAERYELTTDSQTFLNKKSPAYMGTAVDFLLSPSQVEPFQDVAAAIRNDGAVTGQGVIAPEHPSWVTFARAMAPLMALPAELLADLLEVEQAAQLRVLDIAAGHGLYGLALAKRNLYAEITAVDWANVLEVARENAWAARVSERFHSLAGSAFAVEYGGDYDVVLLVNFLHHFALATVEEVLHKVYLALRHGGRAAIVEFIPNEDRISPRVPAAFSIQYDDAPDHPSRRCLHIRGLRASLTNRGLCF